MQFLSCACDSGGGGKYAACRGWVDIIRISYTNAFYFTVNTCFACAYGVCAILISGHCLMSVFVFESAKHEGARERL